MKSTHERHAAVLESQTFVDGQIRQRSHSVASSMIGPGRRPYDPARRWALGSGRALRPGRYEYKFLVDAEWLADPAVAQTVCNQFGSLNSVIVVES